MIVLIVLLAGLFDYCEANAEEQRIITANPVPPSNAGYSVESIIESGQRGGMLIPVGANFTSEFNREMGDAMELWNAHRWEDGTEKFSNIYKNHPESPWAVEAEMHVACYCRFNGLYDEAEEHFLSILEKCRDNNDIKKKVLTHLPDVYYRSGRIHDAKAALDMLKEMPLEWQRQQFYDNWALIFFNCISSDDAERLCGTKALALAMECVSKGQRKEGLRNISAKSVYNKYPWSLKLSSSSDGYSLKELAELSGGIPVQMAFDDLKKNASIGNPVLAFLSAPPSSKLFSRLKKVMPSDYKKSSGHFVVIERANDRLLNVLDPRGGMEVWETSRFKYMWSGKALVLPGQKHCFTKELVDNIAADLRGGCCGSAPVATTKGKQPCVNGPGDKTGGCSSCGGGCPTHGAPLYQFGVADGNIMLDDIPLWYPNEKGPDLSIRLFYNRTEADDGAVYTNINYYPFGNKWSCNFNSYIKENPSSNNVTVYLGDGRHEIYLKISDTQYTNEDYRVNNTYTLTNGYGKLTFESDKSSLYFSTNTQHLVKIEDRYGNAVQLNYDENNRITNAVDEVGRTLTFSYNASGCVTNIMDKLGRSCVFAYSNSNLVEMTDMGGYKTILTYNSSNWVSSITYPNTSSITFEYTSADQLGAPYSSYDEPFRIRATDSLNNRKEFFYHAFDSMGPVTVTDEGSNAWLYAHDAAVPYTYVYSESVNGRYVAGLTCYGDQWTHHEYDTYGNRISTALAVDRYALTIGYYQQYGSSVSDVLREIAYDSNNWPTNTTIKTNGVVHSVRSQQYDSNGNVTWYQDSLSNITRLVYDSKDNLTAVTNALGDAIYMTYDDDGNLLHLTNSMNATTEWIYNTNGFNTSVIFPDSSSIEMTPDSIGRVQTFSDAAGYQISYDYDNLDHIRKITFGDATTLEKNYGCCGLESTKDRLGRETKYAHDIKGRLSTITNAIGGVITLEYNPMNQITAINQLIDGSAKTTRFNYTSTNGFTRLTSRVMPSGKTNNVYSYKFSGWLTNRVDGFGRDTVYTQDVLGRLIRTAYGGNTNVDHSYDLLGNVTKMVDQYGTNAFVYNALNMLTNTTVTTSISGFSNISYHLAYKFDSDGNMTNLVLEGISGFTNVISACYTYDSMSRLTMVSNSSANASYQMDSAGRLESKSYGNNDVTRYGYNSESRLISLVTSNSGNNVQGWYCGYNAMGMITNITNSVSSRVYGYDAIDRLTSESANESDTTWTYDKSGNCLQVVKGTQTNTCWYSADNEMQGQATNLLIIQVTGTVDVGPESNKWQHAHAYANGISSAVNTNNGSFVIPAVPIVFGNNKLTVTVRDDVLAVASTQAVIFTKQANTGEYSFVYDDNGNLSTNITGSITNVLSYDMENRLSQVTSNGVTILQNYYDGMGRRIAKSEFVNGTTNKYLYVYDGWNCLAVLNGTTGAMLEYYTRGAGIGGDIGTIVAATHYSGSFTNGTFYYHNNHRGDVTCIRSGTTTVATYDYKAYGELRSSSGTYTSRYRFSSKEYEQTMGIYYYGYRFYNPSVGRWLTQDPLKEAGGLNQYEFCNSNPVNFTDPFGLVAGVPYPDPDAAARAALQDAYPKAMNRKPNHEYGGWIYRNPADGKYYHTEPKEGSRNKVPLGPNDIPEKDRKTAECEGSYHVHWDARSLWGESFSNDDWAQFALFPTSVNHWLGSASGGIRKYSPSAKPAENYRWIEEPGCLKK